MWFLVVISTLLTALVSLGIYGYRPLQRWRLRHIPGPKPSWLLGNLPAIVAKGKHEAFRHWAKKYGSVYKVFEGGIPTVVIQDPEIASNINSRLPNRHPIPYFETGEEEKFNAAGILFARNAHHRGLKAAWQPMFHSASLKGFVGLMQDSTLKMCREIYLATESGRSIDIWRLFGDLTMRISGKTAFGVELTGDLADSAKAFFDSAGKIENIYALLQLAFPEAAPFVRQLATKYPTPEYQEAMAGRRHVRAAVSALLPRGQITKNEAGGIAPGSFLDLMIKATNKETGKPFTDMEVVCQAFSFILAAYETTSAALAFTVYLLALHPEKEAKMLQEIDAFGRSKVPTHSDVLPYVLSVFKEAMRLYPSVPLTIRQAEKDMLVGKYRVPAGTHIAVSLYGLHHSSKYWEEPEAFRPERFYNQPDNPAYMPFGGGARACIGKQYALQEAMIALIMIYQRYTFELAGDQVPLAVRMSLSLGPKKGVWVKPKLRR